MNQDRRARLLCLVSLLATGCQPAVQPSRAPATDPAQAAYKHEVPAVELPARIGTLPEPPPQAPGERATPTVQRIFPESMIAAPDKDFVSREIAYDTGVSTRMARGSKSAGWQYRRIGRGNIVGFEFSNPGGNRILTPRADAQTNQFFTREFQFCFDERARQDIHLLVTDWAPSRDRQFRLSDLTHTLLHFFPRTVLPAIVNAGNRNIVTLPTGEEVEFDANTHEILAGVLTEVPVDLNPDRSARRFPGVVYTGKGVMVRANSRGADPRISTTATIMSSSSSQACADGSDCEECHVPARELWDQTGAVRFKFSNDQEFDRFLIARCGFGLPKSGADFVIAAPTIAPCANGLCR